MSTEPIETEDEARALPGVRAVFAAARTRKLTDGNHEILCRAVASAGVEPGHYEHHALVWLAGCEPQIVAAIAAVIERAGRR